MKKVISATLILTDREADILSDAIDILKDMTRMFDSTDIKEQEKIARALDALCALRYSDFVDVK